MRVSESTPSLNCPLHNKLDVYAMSSTHQKNKKILLLFFEPYKSGISRHVRYIVDVLQQYKNFDFWLICSSDDQKIPAFFNEVIPIDNIITVPPHRIFSLKGLLATRKIIRQHNIDIVHIHNLQTILWGYSGSIIAGCKNIIFTPHIDTECAGLSQWIFRRIWRIFNPYTSSLIALSHAQKEWLLRWKIIHEMKITVINNHISEKDLRTTVPSKADDPSITIIDKAGPKTIIVTQIGRLDRQKNPFFLIRVAQLVKKEFPEILFLFVGEGPLREKIIETIVALNLQKNVILAGHQNNISRLFEISDIISLTSRWEGVPYVLLEAVCFKKAVIATDIPGNREVVTDGKNGFLVHDEEEFAKKLAILFRSPQLRVQMGETGYQMHHHLFDINNMKEALAAVYRNNDK